MNEQNKYGPCSSYARIIPFRYSSAARCRRQQWFSAVVVTASACLLDFVMSYRLFSVYNACRYNDRQNINKL